MRPYPARRVSVRHGQPEIGDLLILMRQQGILARGTWASDGLPVVVFRPRPTEWPSDLQVSASRHLGALAYLLIPEQQGRLQARSWWSTGKLAGCFGCGRGTAQIDPLGWWRHNWCGWVGQQQQDYLHPGIQRPQKRIHNHHAGRSRPSTP